MAERNSGDDQDRQPGDDQEDGPGENQEQANEEEEPAQASSSCLCTELLLAELSGGDAKTRLHGLSAHG